jgi:aspartokinase
MNAPVLPSSDRQIGNKSACSVTHNACLITISRPGLFNSPEFTAHVLTTAGELGVPVLVISQSSSEGNLCLVVPCSDSTSLLGALYDDLRKATGTITIHAENEIAVINLRYDRGRLDQVAQVYATLDAEQVAILAASCGFGTLSVVIRAPDEWRTLTALRHLGS